MGIIANKQLASELSSLINKYGFSDVLMILETLASNNAEYMGAHWEAVRKNLEESYLEAEEYLISGNYN